MLKNKALFARALLLQTVIMGPMMPCVAWASEVAALDEIVAATVSIMNKNGYPMPMYRVIQGRTDLPMVAHNGVGDFFAYIDAGWAQNYKIISLNFYEANRIPISARVSLISHLLRMHNDGVGTFGIRIYMTAAKYKKVQLRKPEPILLLELGPRSTLEIK